MRFKPFYSRRRPFHPCDAKISYDGRFRASADEKKKRDRSQSMRAVFFVKCWILESSDASVLLFVLACDDILHGGLL